MGLVHEDGRWTKAAYSVNSVSISHLIHRGGDQPDIPPEEELTREEAIYFAELMLKHVEVSDDTLTVLKEPLPENSDLKKELKRLRKRLREEVRKPLREFKNSL